MPTKKGSRTVLLPEHLDKEIRLIAAEERIPVTKIIVLALELWLKARKKTKPSA
jgi:hypothetical protein